MHRRYGPAPERGRAYVARPGIYAVLPRGGRILLTLEMARRWEIQLPGGGIEPGESPLQALHREVLEETGWRIARPRKLGVFRRHTFMPEYDIWAEKICHVYSATPVLRHGAPSEPDHRALWVPLAEAPDLLENPGDRAFAASLL